MKNVILTLLIFLGLFANAQALQGRDLTCKVRDVIQSKSGPGLDQVIQLNLKDCSGLVASDPQLDFQIVWAPQSLKSTLEGLLKDQTENVFTVTQVYAGTLLKLNGQDVGSITPNQDRSANALSIFYAGSQGYEDIVGLLDAKNVAKIPHEERPAKGGRGQPFTSFSRQVTFKGIEDQTLTIKLRENGPSYSAYLSGVQPANALIYVNAVLPPGKRADSDTYVFAASDAKALYAFFGIDASESFRIPLQDGTGGVLACKSNSQCEISQ